jgi:uncharacterized protein with HEPN domain
MRDDRARLVDMLDAMNNIQNYTVLGKDRFQRDELVRTYIIYQLQVLGEAAYKLTPIFRSNHPDVPWPKVMGMRHFLVHDYFRVNYDMVWDTTAQDLSPLKTMIEGILSEHKNV